MNTVHQEDPLIALEIKRQLLKMLASHTLFRMLLVVIAASLMAYFAYSSGFFSPLVLGIWMSLLILMEGVRWWLPKYYFSRKQQDLSKEIVHCVLVLCVNAILLGASCLMFPYVENFQKAIVTMIVMGTSSVVISSTTGYRPIGVFYVFPAMVPPFLMWGLNPVHDPAAGHEWFNIAQDMRVVDMIIAIIGIGYAVVLVASGSDSFNRFTESVVLRYQLDGVNRQLKKAMEKSEEANAAKTRFLAAASHDLRQPIHTVTLLSAALELQVLDGKARSIVTHINDSLAGLSSQLDRLLDISKLDAGVVTLDESVFDLSVLVMELSRDYAVTTEEKGLGMSCKLLSASYVSTDRGLVERIIRNLIDNAIKYTDSGRIELIQGERDGFYFISIEDTGRGLEDRHKSKIFEEFYQIDNPGRDRKQGLGLGLAIVERLTKLLNIHLEFESEFGKGSVFTLLIPKHEKPAQLMRDPIRLDTNMEGKLDPVRLLVLDDEYEIRWGMKVLFEEKGYEVIAAESISDALVAVQTFIPDVLLVDFRLGTGGNGIDAINELRAVLGDVPALLISGDTAPDRLLEAKKAGVKLLSKPVSVEALESAMLDEVNDKGGSRVES